MTYEEAQKQVAEKHGLDHYLDANVYNRANELAKEVAELYAKSKWNEACKAQQRVFFNTINPDGIPEFKP